jgi:hypothetical protein
MTSCGADVPRGCLQKGLVKNTNVKEFHRVFPDVFDEVGYFYGIGSKLTWYSRSVLHKRYLVMISFTVDCEGTNFREVSQPKITLIEFYNPGENVTSDGANISRSSLASMAVSEIEWSKLTSPEDFFDLVEVVPIKDKPVKRLLEIKESWEEKK